MRKLVMLAVCLALALQGVAQAGVVEKPCPMRKHTHMHTTGAKVSHHCCNDADTAAKTGRVCKMGQACPAAGAWVMNHLPTPSVPVVTTSSVVDSREPFALRIDSGGHWRPPALS